MFFIDDNFFGYKKSGWKRAIEIANKMIEENLIIPFAIDGRIDDMEYNVLAELRKAGLGWIFIGIDSLSNDQLIRYNKGYTVDFVRKKYPVLEKVGVDPIPMFILFDAMTSRNEVIENLTNMLEIGVLPKFTELMSRLTVIVGSSIERQYKDMGILSYEGPIPSYQFLNQEATALFDNFSEITWQIYEIEMENEMEAYHYWLKEGCKNEKLSEYEYKTGIKQIENARRSIIQEYLKVANGSDLNIDELSFIIEEKKNYFLERKEGLL